MQSFFMRLGQYRPQLLSILRIVTALLFLEHATWKLFNFPALQFPSPAAFSGFWWIGVLEIIGSLALLFGFFTRLAAFILSGEMAIAYWTTHAQHGLYPLANMGEAAILFCFIFLYIAASGPGPWSVDAAQKSSMA